MDADSLLAECGALAIPMKRSSNRHPNASLVAGLRLFAAKSFGTGKIYLKGRITEPWYTTIW